MALGFVIQLTVLYFRNIFPTRLVWLSAASIALGGGNAVLVAIIQSIVTDATSEQERSVSFSAWKTTHI